MYERNDLYDQCLGKQFVCRAPVIGMAKSKNGMIFFAREGVGQTICLYANRHVSPVSMTNGFPLVLAADWATTLNEVKIGTVVHAVCVPAPNHDPRAVRWCTEAEFEACEREIQQILREKEEAAAEIRLEQVMYEDDLARKQKEMEEVARKRHEELGANPRTYTEAIALGWEEVQGLGNGRQRILERKFAGESKPRRITRHLPSTKLMKAERLSPRLFSRA